MEQLKKPSIISGRTVIISMRILILIFCKSTNIRGETCIFAFKQSEIAMTAKEKIDQLRCRTASAQLQLLRIECSRNLRQRVRRHDAGIAGYGARTP